MTVERVGLKPEHFSPNNTFKIAVESVQSEVAQFEKNYFTEMCSGSEAGS